MKKIWTPSHALKLVAFCFLATSLYGQQFFDNYRKFEQALSSNQKIIHLNPADTIKEVSYDIDTIIASRSTQKAAWTVIVYMAADNDLRAFVEHNLSQMMSVGSNHHLNIVVHLDWYKNGQKMTKRCFIDKNRVIVLNNNDPKTQQMDSGNPNTLISCCEWAVQDFPAEQYALILWNHGTGIIDPPSFKIINPAELFTFNPSTNKFELDRAIGFLDLLYFMDHEERGICWDNTTGNYLTNEKFDYALKEICTNVLHGKKFSIIAFDACLMSMIEIANLIKNYSDIMIGSQEVELGTGWNYHKALSPIANGMTDKYQIATNIVLAFQRAYQNITNDYTQSAIDLTRITKLENNVHEFSQLLCRCLALQKNNSVKKAIKCARNKRICIHFDEPSYIDLYCFYENFLQQLSSCVLKQNQELLGQLRQKLKEGQLLVQETVFSNTTGKNLNKARGLSIYFPDRHIRSSYPKTTFAQKNHWYNFLTTYLK